MNENNTSKKLLSLICLIAGIVLLVFSLVLDFSGSGATYRGWLLVIGVVGIIAGLYFFPTLRYHRAIIHVIFLFPLLFTFVVTVILPLLLGLYYSFTDWNGIKMTQFVGFENYAKMFKNPAFIWSILVTFLFVVFNMILVNLVAFLLALLCTSKLKGMGFFRASYFLSHAFELTEVGFVGFGERKVV